MDDNGDIYADKLIIQDELILELRQQYDELYILQPIVIFPIFQNVKDLLSYRTY